MLTWLRSLSGFGFWLASMMAHKVMWRVNITGVMNVNNTGDSPTNDSTRPQRLASCQGLCSFIDLFSMKTWVSSAVMTDFQRRSHLVPLGDWSHLAGLKGIPMMLPRKTSIGVMGLHRVFSLWGRICSVLKSTVPWMRLNVPDEEGKRLMSYSLKRFSGSPTACTESSSAVDMTCWVVSDGCTDVSSFTFTAFLTIKYLYHHIYSICHIHISLKTQ